MALDPSRLSAAQLGRLLLGSQLDAVELTEFFLDRIATAGDPHVFIRTTPERARREAAESRRRYREGRPLGPLDGVPVAWKDLFDLAGTPTTAGAGVRRDAAPAPADAPVVAHLTAAGMVALGKVNLTEFAFSGIGINPHFGTPANPHDAARVCGGSSSGSAAAIAGGLAPVAIGSDTGGSVRIPAAFCGVVGHKTSTGRVDKAGVFPLSPTLDTVGPLARTVEDLVLLDTALRGAVASPVRRAELGGLRLVVPESVVFDGIEDAVAANFESALLRLERAGARIERRPFPVYRAVLDLMAATGPLAAAESYVVHKALVESPDADRLDPRVLARILPGRDMTAHDLLVLQAGRRDLIARARAELGDALLAQPTVPHVAPEIAVLDADPALFHQINVKTLRNTMLGNFLDHCAVALPTGTDSAGLPTSLQLAAPHGEDERLLGVALAAEGVLGGG